jgi:hypothetical protein
MEAVAAGHFAREDSEKCDAPPHGIFHGPEQTLFRQFDGGLDAVDRGKW